MTAPAADHEDRQPAGLPPEHEHHEDPVDDVEPAPAAEPSRTAEPVDQDDAPTLNFGTPVGQLAAGATLVLLLGGYLLYRAGGWMWVLIGAGILFGLMLLVAFIPLIWRRLRAGTNGSRTRGAAGLGKLFGRSTSSPGRTAGAGGGRMRAAGRTPSPSSALRALGLGRQGRRQGTSPKSAGGSLLERARKAVGKAGAALTGRRAKSSGSSSRSARGAAGKGSGAPGRIRRAATATGKAVRRAAAAARAAPGRVAQRAAAGGRRIAGAFRAGLTQAAQPFRRVGAFIRRARERDQHLTLALADTVRGWWKRLRKRADQQATTVPATAARADIPAPGAQPRPVPLTSITAPSQATSARAEGRSPMTDFALITHATELPTIASTYESEDMMDVRGHMQMLRELPLAAGTTVRIWTERLAADYPLNQDVSEALQRVYDAFGAVVQACDEASVTFEGSHDADIQRHLQPRTNEQKWNLARS